MGCINLDLPSELHARVKRRAVLEGCTVQAVAADMVKRGFEALQLEEVGHVRGAF